MIKNIVLQHRAERDELLRRSFIPRENLPLARGQLESPLVKVITGPRRAGKSVFSLLLLREHDFAYVNFDDDSLAGLGSTDNLVQAMTEVYGGTRRFFFDEIQNLAGWEMFVNKLQRRGFNIVLTGSNARLLSGELATSLTGRHAPIEVLPFSFREFLQVKRAEAGGSSRPDPGRTGSTLSYLDEYLKEGGFPEVCVGRLDARGYLSTLFDAVILKDIVKRYNVRYTARLLDLATFLISNCGTQISFTGLKKTLGFASVATVQKYVGYLEEAFLFFVINRFSAKLKEQLKAPRKVYSVDNGFIAARAFHISPDMGKLMENAVFLDLLRRGCRPNLDVFYYRTRNNREVDFIARYGNNSNALIQSCYDVSDPRTMEREIRALYEAGDETGWPQMTIITWDAEAVEKYKSRKIAIVPLWKWMQGSTFR